MMKILLYGLLLSQFVLLINSKILIHGSGSSAVGQIMTLLSSNFNEISSTYKVQYDITGSGTGLSNLRSQKNVYDFAQSETLLTDTDYINEPNFQMIPFQVGSISIAANIPELVAQKRFLRLSQKTIVQIFDNTIKYWNDSRIAATNPGISFPGQPIQRLVRQDKSGTTDVFTHALQKFDASWTEVSSLPNWPNQANDPYFRKVTSSKLSITMKIVDYSITYLQSEVGSCNTEEYNVEVQNLSGSFVQANETTTKAAIDIAGLSFNSRFVGDFLNPQGVLSYPINSCTYFIYRSDNGTNCDKAAGLYYFAKKYMFSTTGNAIVKSVLNFPVADSLIILPKIDQTLDQLTCNGKKLKYFFVPRDYTMEILGSSLGAVGGIVLLFLFSLLIIGIVVGVIFIHRSRKRSYYQNLIT